MESFLDRAGSSLGDRLGHSKVDNNKVRSFLFNPKPRQRKRIPSSISEHPCGDRGNHGFGGASNYWKLRTAKCKRSGVVRVNLWAIDAFVEDDMLAEMHASLCCV